MYQLCKPDEKGEWFVSCRSTYTLPPGFTDPACGWEVEFIQGTSTVNKYTYANLPAGGVFKIPCSNVSGLLYIRAQLCNGRVKVCHGNDVAHFPDPPCVPMSGVSISFEQVKKNGVCEFFMKVSFTQSSPATTSIKLDYREWNAIAGDRFNGTIQVAPNATSFKKQIYPVFTQSNMEQTIYYVTVIDACNNGLPQQVTLNRTCF